MPPFALSLSLTWRLCNNSDNVKKQKEADTATTLGRLCSHWLLWYREGNFHAFNEFRVTGEDVSQEIRMAAGPLAFCVTSCLFAMSLIIIPAYFVAQNSFAERWFRRFLRIWSTRKGIIESVSGAIKAIEITDEHPKKVGSHLLPSLPYLCLSSINIDSGNSWDMVRVRTAKIGPGYVPLPTRRTHRETLIMQPDQWTE